MTRRVAYLAASAGLLAALGGCALNFLDFDRREAWRADAEKACFAQRLVPDSPTIQRVRSINQNGGCGLEMPLQISALDRGLVQVGPTAVLGCPQTAALESWLRGAVQPAAIAYFGTPVVGIRQMSAYACRPMNNRRGAKISEHAFGNALDVGSFQFADGRSITVKDDWSGPDPEARAFLREIHSAACQYFTTVLGPGVPQHGDHFHLDLAHHGRSGTSHYCKPTPQRVPVRPTLDNQTVAAIPGRLGVPAYTVVEPTDAEVNELVFGGNPFGVGGTLDPRLPAIPGDDTDEPADLTGHD